MKKRHIIFWSTACAWLAAVFLWGAGAVEKVEMPGKMEFDRYQAVAPLPGHVPIRFHDPFEGRLPVTGEEPVIPDSVVAGKGLSAFGMTPQSRAARPAFGSRRPGSASVPSRLSGEETPGDEVSGWGWLADGVFARQNRETRSSAAKRSMREEVLMRMILPGDSENAYGEGTMPGMPSDPGDRRFDVLPGPFDFGNERTRRATGAFGREERRNPGQ